MSLEKSVKVIGGAGYIDCFASSQDIFHTSTPPHQEKEGNPYLES
jgi:hypothetical protein